jgi:hypothetical protein
VLLASTTLALELLLQVPFLGPSVLQAIFGTIAIGMAITALRARRSGSWPRAARLDERARADHTC